MKKYWMNIKLPKSSFDDFNHSSASAALLSITCWAETAKHWRCPRFARFQPVPLASYCPGAYLDWRQKNRTKRRFPQQWEERRPANSIPKMPLSTCPSRYPGRPAVLSAGEKGTRWKKRGRSSLPTQDTGKGGRDAVMHNGQADIGRHLQL